MSHNQLDTLIRMINQIAANNRAYQTEEAAERVANHVKRFWARSMKQMMIDYYLSDGEALCPVAKQAVGRLIQDTEKKPQDTVSAGQAG
ncbi:MAG: hypothetical protein Kow0083_16020 [Methylophaga sp.]|jgi:formate dehydrogenase subunit delta